MRPSAASRHGLLVTLLGCADGNVEVRAWGEAYVETGIPATVMSDGWTVDFDRFEVELRAITIAGVELADPGPIDLTGPSDGVGQLLGRASVPAGDHDDAMFSLARVRLEGSASKGDVRKTFAWEFAAPIHFFDCETSTTVPPGGTGELQITFHADHLFFDSVVSQTPTLRFDPLAAADLDGDDVITREELAVTNIGAYDRGNLEIDDLWAFLAVQATTLAHVDGEGHCIGTPD